MNTNLPTSYQSRSGAIFTITELDSGEYQVATRTSSQPAEVFRGTEPDVTDFLAVVQMLDHTEMSEVGVDRIQDYLLRLLKGLNYRSQQ